MKIHSLSRWALQVGVALSGLLILPRANAVPAMTLDLLQLPAENRRMALQGLSNEQFNKLKEVAFAENEPMRLRWKALVSLAEADPEKAWPLLQQASNSKSWFMRNAALVAVGETHPLRAQGIANKLLKDKALVVRSAAVQVLHQNPELQDRDLLWGELDQEYNFRRQSSLWIRAQIVELLAEKPLDRERTVFARLLGDKDERVHLASIRGLEKLTGVRLGFEKMPAKNLVGLWQNYLQKEKLF